MKICYCLEVIVLDEMFVFTGWWRNIQNQVCTELIGFNDFLSPVSQFPVRDAEASSVRSV